MAEGQIKFSGFLGGTLAWKWFRGGGICGLHWVGKLKAACGILGRGKACFKLEVFISATADFTQHPKVANDASELIASVLGEAGKHARSSVGVPFLPRGAAVEVDAVFELA